MIPHYLGIHTIRAVRLPLDFEVIHIKLMKEESTFGINRKKREFAGDISTSLLFPQTVVFLAELLRARM